jgi:hypothetical protein
MPKDDSFSPEEQDWTFLKEPPPSTLLFISVLLGVFFGLGTTFLWVALTPIKLSRLSLLYSLLAFPCIIPLHELAHALILPAKKGKHKTFFGFWPARFAFYVYYTGPLSRSKYMTISIFPYVLLSILPLLICALFRITSFIVAYAGIANSFLCSADFATLLIVLCRVPAGTILRQQGCDTWWMIVLCRVPAGTILRQQGCDTWWTSKINQS